MTRNDIEIKLAQLYQAEEIYEVMKKTYEKLECKSLLVCDDIDLFRKCLKKDGFIVVASDSSSKIVGYSMIYYPGQSTENLGREIGLSNDELNSVAHFESSAVLPEYRGLGLQLAMQIYAEEIIDKTRYRYIMCTISPDNKWSRANIEKSGLHYVCTKEKYGGLLRDIMVKCLVSKE